MRRWISTVRPSILPREMSRDFRSSVEYGSIEYSAVSQPPGTFCCFIQVGTPGSMVAAQMTRVAPKETRTEPVACGAMPASKEIGRSWLGLRPSSRGAVDDMHERERRGVGGGKAQGGADFFGENGGRGLR